MSRYDEEYNGWTNWHTLNANLHLTNNEVSYKCALKCRNANELKEFWKRCFEGIDDIETDKINFEEIYQGLKED